MSYRQKLHLSYGFDRNYLLPFCVAVTSVFLNNANLIITFHVISPGLTEVEKEWLRDYIESYHSQINYYEIDESILGDLRIPDNTYFTSAIYHRLLIPHLVPFEIDKLLYLDTDTLVCGNLSTLYNLNINQFGVAAASDNQMLNNKPLACLNQTEYFNSGVLLINLRLWISLDVTKKALEFIRTNSNVLRFPDQDALNHVLKNRWVKFDQKYNLMRWDIPFLEKKDKKKFLQNTVILHFNDNNKPWDVNCTHHFKYLFDEYSISFFKSEIGRKLVASDLEVQILSIVMQLFRKETYDITTLISNAFIFHLCWIKGLSSSFNNEEQELVLNYCYKFSAYQETGRVGQELDQSFEANKSFLLSIYDYVMFSDAFNQTINEGWVIKWLHVCQKYSESQKPYLNFAGNLDQVITIPKILNRRLKISSQVEYMLNYFIYKSINSKLNSLTEGAPFKGARK